MTKTDESEMMSVLGAIAAGEFDSVLIIGEKHSAAGEVSLVVRMGGCTEDGARRMAACGLWSKGMPGEREKVKA